MAKRGELPSIAELNANLKLKEYVVIDREHRYCTDNYRKGGKKKRVFVKLMNIKTGEKTEFMATFEARRRYGTPDKSKISVHKHTDETVSKFVTSASDGNASLLKWEHNSGTGINVKVKFNSCGCIIDKSMYELTPDCPICNGKWKTEDAVCKLVESLVDRINDKDVDIFTKRQVTVSMYINNKKVYRRFDLMVKLQHKKDSSINHFIAIEYQGECHFKPVNYGNLSEEVLQEAFRQYQIRDKQKRKYCKEKNIPLIEITYKEKEKIYTIVNTKVRDEIWDMVFLCVGRYYQMR